LNIILAELKHVDAIHVIECECFPDPWSRKSFESEINEKHSYLFVAVDENETVLGFASMWHIVNEGQICNIAVSPKFRSCGVGTRLLEKLISIAGEMDMIGLTLEVRVSNTPAINLYKKYGFKQEGLRKNYYENPTEDAIIMWIYL